MHEQQRHGDTPREQLIALLQWNFTQPASGSEHGGSALTDFLRDARSVEDIDVRFASAGNLELGEAVERLLAPAPVTRSFKRFIASEVRRAHAWQSTVDDVVAPDRLGLLSGEGIFDPAHSKDLEAQALRGRAFDIMHRYTTAFTVEGEDETIPPQLFLTGSVRPSDYTQAVDVLDEWGGEYRQTYDEDPFEGLPGEVFLDAGGRVAVPKDSGMAGLVKRLREAQGLAEE